MQSSKIYLDVGGTPFVTCKQTLCREADSYFSRLFSGDWTERRYDTPDTALFIDQDPDSFALILDFLRYGRLRLPDNRGDLVDKVKAGAEYFGLEGLILYLDENFDPPVFFKCEGAPTHNPQDVGYQSIVKYCESQSKFMKLVESELKNGRGTRKNPVMLELTGYLQSFMVFLDWLRIGYITPASLKNLHEFQLLDCFRNFARYELRSAALCLNHYFEQFMKMEK